MGAEKRKGRRAWNKDLTKETDPRIPSSWKRGLTKETDKRVADSAKAMGETRKRLYSEGKLTSWNKNLTKETDARVAGQSKKLEGHPSWNRLAMLKNWQNSNYREKTVRAILKGMKIKPDRPEKIVICLVQKYTLPFRYTGDGDKVIEGFNPDLEATDGSKKLIEVFGDYWHNKPKWIERDKRRLIAYKKHGYDTLIIWEHELKDLDAVVAKLKAFAKKGHASS